MRAASGHQRFGPSLARRVFLAIIISNTLFLFFIFIKTILIYQDIKVSAGVRWIERGSYRLNQLTSGQDARLFGAAWEKGFYCPTTCYIEVWSHDGERIYTDRKSPDRPQLIGANGQITRLIINGENHDLLRHDGPRWSLRIATHAPNFSHALRMAAPRRQHYLPPLIFFLFLVPPLWFAVRRGLAPLRALASHLGRREADDLSPLSFHTRYRELQPLVVALDALLLQLRGKVQREYAFLQDAAHELRTPIAVIPAEAHILARASTPLAQHTAKQRIDHAMARAAHLIAQLSELARVDAPSGKESQLLDVVQLVKLDLMQMEQGATARQMKMLLEAPDTLSYPVEANTFQSILHNLVSNAIRYGRVGGMVVVTLRHEGRNLRLQVFDDGRGISPAQREQVFERFYRGLGHETSGSGLGLAIVRQAAARLNARLELAEGLLGRGCGFSVLIPDPADTSGQRDETRA